MGSPLAAYSAISRSVSGANQTAVDSTAVVKRSPRRRQMPVRTSCLLPESSAEHPARIGFVLRLPEQMMVDGDGGIGAEDNFPGASRDRARLGFRQPATYRSAVSPASAVSSTCAARL